MRTEEERMLAGEVYNSMDETLCLERAQARHLFQQLNHVRYGDMDAYNKIRAQLFPNAASDFWVEPPFYCDYGYNIRTGTNVYFNFNCVVLDVCVVTIGSKVMLGPNVQIYTATHPLSAIERCKGAEFGVPISMGNDCWIGGSAVICPGVHIGNGCVIGAGSVVTRDTPDGTIAVGNPARVIGKVPCDDERTHG
ncbi:sugar O-acetyltransferase [Candidatus Bipolaricaulota bacterium]|nr:sugar O-acetyltransferase [Candidatus Bipolaricaulota bacterium]